MRCPTAKTMAFSLIELLVVISVIAVLAALSFPAVNRAFNSSKTSICASNLRQISCGLNLYAVENEGCYPLAVKQGSTGQEYTWGYAIWTYVGYAGKDFNYTENDLQGNVGRDKNMFHCPVTKQYRAKTINTIRMPAATGSAWNIFSYAMNNAPNYVYSGSPYIPLRTTQIVNPSKTALILEQDENPGNQFVFLSYYGLLPHSKASNVLYADGHVSLLRAEDFPSAKGFTDTGLSEFWSGRPSGN